MSQRKSSPGFWVTLKSQQNLQGHTIAKTVISFCPLECDSIFPNNIPKGEETPPHCPILNDDLWHTSFGWSTAGSFPRRRSQTDGLICSWPKQWNLCKCRRPGACRKYLWHKCLRTGSRARQATHMTASGIRVKMHQAQVNRQTWRSKTLFSQFFQTLGKVRPPTPNPDRPLLPPPIPHCTSLSCWQGFFSP